MSEMQIVIPTKGRIGRQLTLTWLPRELLERTTLVCPEKEVFALCGLNDHMKVVAQPDPNWGIAEKRAWILQEWSKRGHDKVLMLDDDLRFATRKNEGDWHLRECTKFDMVLAIGLLEKKLGEEFPAVGFGQRQGNQNVAVGWQSPAKMTYSLGFYLPVVLEICQLNRVKTREDYDIILQLLEAGYPNAVLHTYVNDQREFNAVGGCTSERTIESANDDAYTLASLHPKWISVVEKKYKDSTPRKEVVCQWVRAYEEGKRNRESKDKAQNIGTGT